jgi:hypothetical protein
MPAATYDVSEVSAQVQGLELAVSWVSQAPEGARFQVYVNGRLSWSGTSRRCRLPIPANASGRPVWVDVLAVAAGDAYRDFSSSLPSYGQGSARASLSWLGATYLDPTGRDDVQGFHIYASPSAGQPVDWSSPVDQVSAYPGGWVCDGFGLGGFGQGGFGRAATTYRWESESLPGGTWQFAVVPYDGSGADRGRGSAVSLLLTSAPLAPAADQNGNRLTYTYSGPATRQVTLSWLASPGSS